MLMRGLFFSIHFGAYPNLVYTTVTRAGTMVFKYLLSVSNVAILN
jgi:hypothetical protein